MTPEALLLLVHAATTCFMAGLVWFVQVVHYPLYARVGVTTFTAYEQDHVRRTNWVVAPLMGLEALAAGLLLLHPPAGVDLALVWIAALLLAGIWLATFTLQVPRHAALLRSFDPGVHASLVRTNWLRTTSWTIRAALSLVFLVSFRPS
jgi:hypothetical protein